MNWILSNSVLFENSKNKNYFKDSVIRSFPLFREVTFDGNKYNIDHVAALPPVNCTINVSRCSVTWT